MAARLAEMVVAVILGMAALMLGFDFGASLMLLLEKGIFVPVLMPVILPVAGARVAADLDWVAAEA